MSPIPASEVFVVVVVGTRRSHRSNLSRLQSLSCDLVLREVGRNTMLSLVVVTLLITVSDAMPQKHIPVLTSAAGEGLSLQCALENTNKNVIIWKKGDRVLFAGSVRVRHDTRINVEKNILRIDNIETGDAGQFSCEIEDNQGQFRMWAVQLVILQAPVVKISQVGGYLAVKQFTNLALTCVGSGVPVPEIRWRRGSKILSRGIGQAGVLLEYVTRQDAGEIVCEASNDVGDVATDTLTLDVLYAPETKMSQPQISLQPSCGLELQCTIHSPTVPRVEWFHNDMLLKPSDYVTFWSHDNTHVLKISKCDKSIIGQFSCSAENSLGKSESSLQITNYMVEQLISNIITVQEEDSNNVRRNVAESAPYTSSSADKTLHFTFNLLTSTFLIKYFLL